jgi:hypothetical protein
MDSKLISIHNEEPVELGLEERVQSMYWARTSERQSM